MKDFEILPTTKEEWFDKYTALLKEIDKTKDKGKLAYLKKLNKKYFELAEKIKNGSPKSSLSLQLK